MAKIQIRKIQKGDTPGLKKNVFTNMSVADINKNILSNVEEMAKGGTWTYLVAELDGEAIGTTYVRMGQRSIDKHIAELYTVVVGEDYRGQGVCRALVEKSKEIAKDQGAEILLTSVRQGTPAEKVYEKLGFITYGNLENGIKEGNKYYNEKFFYQKLAKD